MASATKRIILSSGWVKIAEAKGREAMAMIDAYGAVQLAVADGEPPRGDVTSGHSLNGSMMWPVKGAEIIWARGAGVAVSVTLLKVVPEFATLDSAALKVATASAQAVATAAAGAAATADAKAVTADNKATAADAKATEAQLAAGPTPQMFGDGSAGWQVPINAAIDALHAQGGGRLVIPPLDMPYEITAPIQLRSNVNLCFVGNPTIRLANGANCNVIETFGYVGQAEIGFTSRDNECERWSLTGKVVLDGNRANNPSPGPYEGNGLATFGRDFLVEDVYCLDNYRCGAQTHYVASGTVGLSPFGGKINRLTCHSQGEHGWVNGCSDLMFSQINILNASRNDSGTYDAIHLLRGARGSGLTIWRVGGVAQSHRYAVYVGTNGVFLGSSLSLETGLEGQICADGTVELQAVKSYNMIGAGKPHIILNAPNCRISGSIEQGSIGAADATAIQIAGTAVRGAYIDLSLSGSFGKIIDVTGTSQGGNMFAFEVNGSQGAPIIAGSLNASDEVRYNQSGGNPRSLRKRSASSTPVTAAGTSQASALASANAEIRMAVSRINSSGPGNTAVVMPAAIPGLTYQISNPNVRDVLIFPQSGEAFTGLATDASFTLPQGKAVIVFCDVAARWFVVGG